MFQPPKMYLKSKHAFSIIPWENSIIVFLENDYIALLHRASAKVRSYVKKTKHKRTTNEIGNFYLSLLQPDDSLEPIETHDIILNCACVDTSSFFRGLVLYEDNRSCPSKDQRIKNNLLAMSSTSTEYFTECFGSIKLTSTNWKMTKLLGIAIGILRFISLTTT